MVRQMGEMNADGTESQEKLSLTESAQTYFHSNWQENDTTETLIGECEFWMLLQIGTDNVHFAVSN